MEKICVAVRVRPPVPTSSDDGEWQTSNERCWRIEDNRISLHSPFDSNPASNNALSFAFDHVFDRSSSNGRIYGLLIKDIITAAARGFNGTVFAYGQTSSGKTYTMNGSEDDPGIIHLAIKDIFKNIQMMTDREFLIRISYMEIYNEEINDLFCPDNQKLRIHENLERGIYVAGLREEIVSNTEQVLNLIKVGEANRHVGQTNANVRSSRSHTIFRMVIESRGNDASCSGKSFTADAVRVSVLNLVDLAGSERIAKTGAEGERLKEGKHINKSLLTLGNVINKLSDGGKQRGHIPYRDSKLTRILQPALGGNAKTSIICTVAPEEVHIEETKVTLKFASRAKCITNCAQVNEILTDAALLKRQKLEIEQLREQLQGHHSEVLEQEIFKLRNEMLKSELEREKLAMELEEERKLHKERDHCTRAQKMKADNLSSCVHSDQGRNSCQGVSTWQSFSEERIDSHSMSHSDSFRTPSSEARANTFVAKRSDYSRLPDSSPLSINFVDATDEDLWLGLNKGCITDLDKLQMTPGLKANSVLSSYISPVLSLQGKLEIGRAAESDHRLKEVYEQRCNALEKECSLLREEKDSLAQALAEETQKRKDIEEDIQRFGLAFARRGGLLKSVHDKFKMKLKNPTIPHAIQVLPPRVLIAK
ncbi:Kinesin-like protein NACK2 [Acorus gramineus]|uniref:Kinesin-like protein n=1 Tax=Acorus gramineus TaxID=55184 RepID=A0AAV9BI84_ACOGR|nr:Kinesin-like protein NACK2 [Acorus gramineus]